MSNFNLKLDLTKIPYSFVSELKGTNETKRCVCIPVDSFGVFEGQKGVYLDLRIVERKQAGEYGDTHFASLSVQGEVYKAMTDEQKKAIPIIGSMKPAQQAEVKSRCRKHSL